MEKKTKIIEFYCIISLSLSLSFSFALTFLFATFFLASVLFLWPLDKGCFELESVDFPLISCSKWLRFGFYSILFKNFLNNSGFFNAVSALGPCAYLVPDFLFRSLALFYAFLTFSFWIVFDFLTFAAASALVFLACFDYYFFDYCPSNSISLSDSPLSISIFPIFVSLQISLCLLI